VVGGSSDDVFIFDDGWGNYTIISGGTIDEDILDFSAVSANLIFTLHNDGKVSVTDGTNTLGASAGIENIIGGSGTNTFVFEDQGGLEGYIEGAGTNILDYSAYTTAISLDLSTMDVLYEGYVNGGWTQSYGVAYATGLKGANNITEIIGGSSTNDILIGPEQNSAWTIDGAGSGTLTTSTISFTFSGIENITGSIDFNDSFTVTAAGSLSGLLSGNPYGYVSSATHLEIPMKPAGVAEGTDTLTLTGGTGTYSNVTLTAMSEDAGVIARDDNKLRFAGFESVVDNSAASNRTFTYAADSTVKVTLGGGVGKDQSWGMKVDGDSYSYTAGENDDLEDVVAGLAANIADGGYLTIVQDLSILITNPGGSTPTVVAETSTPAVVRELPVTGFASVESPILKDISLRVSKDGSLHITGENGEFTPFTSTLPLSHLYVKTGMGDDTITVEQFPMTAALDIDAESGNDRIFYEVQGGASEQTVTFGATDIKQNSNVVFTYSNVESAKNLVIKATDDNDHVELYDTGTWYTVGVSTFASVYVEKSVQSLTIDLGQGDSDSFVSYVGTSETFAPALKIMAEDTGNDSDDLNLRSGNYSMVTFGGEFESVNWTGHVEDFVFDARSSIANRVHVFKDYSGKITIVDETDIWTTITSINAPTGSLTINTGYNAPATNEYIHVGEDPDGILKPLGTLNGDLILNAGSLNKNLDGEDSVVILGELTLPGHSLSITSNNIWIGQRVEIELVNGFPVPVLVPISTVVSTSDVSRAGDISITGFHVVLAQGAQLRADGAVGDISTSGDITIKAMDESALLTPLVDVDVSDVDVTIAANAVISGRDVTILASSDNRRLYAEDGTMTGTALNTIGGIFEMLTTIGGAISVVTGDASIDIAAGSQISAQNFKADASVYADVKAIPFLEFGVSPSIGVAVTNAEVNVAGTITTTGNAEFRTHTDHTMNVVADTSAIKGISAAIAVSVIVSDANTIVSDTALLNIGGDLYVTADTVDRNRTMARSGAGKDGKVALSVAVTVEDGDTNAFLDGEAHVTGNISVTADQQGLDVPISKVYIMPSLAIGTSAGAGVGGTSKGDFLDDAKATGTNALINPIKNALMPFITKAKTAITGKAATYGPEPPADFGSKFDLAGAVAVLVDSNRAIARIGVSPTHTTDTADQVDIDPGAIVAVTDKHTGGGVVGNWYKYIGDEILEDVNLITEDFSDTDKWEVFENPHVDAGGSIDVISSVSTAPYVSANASASSNSDTAGSQNTSEISGSLAISVGIFNNISEAYINENAVVDAAETLTVQAQAASDYKWSWGINLIDALTEQATYLVDDSVELPWGALPVEGMPAPSLPVFPVDIDAGDTVQVESNHTGTGIVGTWYTAKKSLTGVDLVTENFNNSSNWEVVIAPAGDPTYKTTDRIVTIIEGDTVDFQAGSNGDVGTWYEFLGTADEVINLTTEDFTNEKRWSAINPISRKAENFVTVLSNYLTGDFGVGYFILNDGAQASAEGEKLAIAGAVSILTLNDAADARIKSGAQINQDNAYRLFNLTAAQDTNLPGVYEWDGSAWKLQASTGGESLPAEGMSTGDLFVLTGGSDQGIYEYDGSEWVYKTDASGTVLPDDMAQDVIVQGISHGKAVHIGGNISFPTMSGDATTFKDFGAAVKKSFVEDKTWIPKFATKAKDGKGAVGITIMGFIGTNHALATIEDGVRLHADSLWVDAETGALSVDVAASGGEAGTVGVNGVITFNVIINETIAQIENGAVIDIGSGSVFDDPEMDPADNGSLIVSAP